MRSSLDNTDVTDVHSDKPILRRRVRIFRRVDHWLNRVFRAASAMHEGFWLGCMIRNDLNSVTAGFYDKSRWYGSKEHNESGLFDWEAQAVSQHFRPGSRILVAGAGAGRELLALHRAGFMVEGFECNADLLRIGRSLLMQNGGPDSLTLCQADQVPSGSPDFDGLIVGWGAYTHIPSRARRIRFLEMLRQRAVAHSPVLLSFLTRDGSSRYDGVVGQCARLSGLLSRTSNDYAVELGDHLSREGFRHLFVRAEIESELKAAGFELTLYSEDSYGHAVGIVV